MPSYDLVVVHPLVLLSVVDHYNRVAKDTKKRVVGILLGETYKGRVDITNCFAVPFEEDDRDPNIWFLDHSYLEGMSAMFKKVNAKERILGFYSTGPRLREADLDISDLLSGYSESPLLLICEVQPKEMGLPTTAYYPKEQIREDGTQKSQKVFVNIPTEVGATEAEEIGVEHLLRDVKDSTVSNLSSEVSHMASGLRALKSRLSEVQEYLNLVLEGRLPVNHDIMYHLQQAVAEETRLLLISRQQSVYSSLLTLCRFPDSLQHTTNSHQDVFNLLPNLSVEELLRSFAIKSNDMMLAVYLASMIRSVLALHNLIDNQEQRVWQEKLGQKRPELKNGKAKEDSKAAAKEDSKAKTEQEQRKK